MKPTSEIMVKFGMRIRELRLARGISQAELAEICNLDRSYISSIEHGRRNVCLKNIAIIAFALKVSLSQLFEKVILDE